MSVALYTLDARVHRVEVYRSAIDPMWSERGPIGRFARRLTVDAYMEAYQEAPYRSGTLVEGLTYDVRRTSPRHRIGEVRSTAPHSQAVIYGTSTIPTRRGRWENGQPKRWPLRSVPGPGSFRPRTGPFPSSHTGPLKGQQPNNFMQRALDRAF